MRRGLWCNKALGTTKFPRLIPSLSSSTSRFSTLDITKTAFSPLKVHCALTLSICESSVLILVTIFSSDPQHRVSRLCFWRLRFIVQRDQRLGKHGNSPFHGTVMMEIETCLVWILSYRFQLLCPW